MRPVKSGLRLYTLLDRVAVPCADWHEWALAMESTDRQVAETEIGRFCISTVFLGVDMNPDRRRGAEPLVFETMIFSEDDPAFGDQMRCSTWDQAETLHDEAVNMIRRWATLTGGAGA